MYGTDRWLAIAKEDLLAAKHLLQGEFYSTAVFHCQQSAEKSLKGFLVFHKVAVMKTHDLVGLLTLCCDKDQTFSELLGSSEYLNPFSTKFRYPSEYGIPDEEDATKAVEHANHILVFVRRKVVSQKVYDGQNTLFS